MAIMNPLRPHMGKRATLCIAIFIWIVGAILSLPMLLFYTTYTQNFANGEIRVICYGDFPNRDDNGLSYDEYLWAYLNNRNATFFFPISCMLIRGETVQASRYTFSKNQPFQEP